MTQTARTRLACIALATAGLTGPAAAEAPRVHALTGARVVVEPGRVLESATVVLRDGIIEAVGADVPVPADARTWELDELTIYPGLIEPYAVRARAGAAEAAEPEDGGGPRPGGESEPMVRSEHSVTPYAADDDAARRLREAGFTTALAAPAEGIFRGTGAVLNLGAGGARDNLLRDGFGQFAAFDRAAAGYPGSLMGAIALFRQTVLDAGWYTAAHRAYARRPAQTRPRFDASLAALAAVAAGDELVVFETDGAFDTLRAGALAAELGLTAWVVGNGEEYRWLDHITAADLPHLLPVDFPETPAVPEQDDLTVTLADLRHWDEAPANPRRLLDAGLTIAFTSHGLADPKTLHANLGRARERGLTADEALAALTTTPARLLGIADRAGTVSPGKMGNLVVVEGDLFTDETKIREVWIDGRRYEIKEVLPPEVEPAGTWQLTVETPDGQKLPVTLILAGKAPSLSGTVSAMGSDPLPLSAAEVSAKSIEITFDSTGLGMPGSITFNLEIDGDQAAGNGVSPSGPFSISGSRTVKPEEAP